MKRMFEPEWCGDCDRNCVVDDPCPCCVDLESSRVPPERAILTDLIAELVGDDGDSHEMTPDGEACAVCVAIDRAEARLREVGGDE